MYDFHSEYNPQKSKGKPYIDNNRKKTHLEKNVYTKDKLIKIVGTVNESGDRYPSSILKFNNPQHTIHRTQKPVKLYEYLIKTYSNEGDNVIDFCMGSGTCYFACKELNRSFIGIEKDEEIYKKFLERKNNL
ncbi:MAG: site-specific DNA-methyltransferase [bacterium]|nr:site-specific DNA-methyltransferase [bacterium]